MQLIRLETVHPLLTHFTVGALPLLVLAYALACFKRSARWAFVGDVALVLTAVITLATAAFGLVSNFVLAWPGGLGLWRWLHLGFGAGAAALLSVFAVARIVRRRRSRVSGAWALSGALAVAAVVGFTGWIGGEVLVYRSGMAVTAAAGGALAPPADGDAKRAPEDLVSAMHRLRGDWAVTQSTMAHMIVEEPTPAGYRRIARHAGEIARVADWIAAGEVPSHEGEEEEGLVFAQAGGAPDGAHAHPPADGALSSMAGVLAEHARSVQEAARAEDVVRLATAVSEVSSSCAGCHEELRWGKAHEH